MNEPLPVVRTVDHGTARLLPDVDRSRAWLLTVDDAPQSYVDLDDTAHLEFAYTRRIAHVIDAAGPGGPLDLLHLGGGGLTLPRYTAAVRPGSRQTVVDADEALLALVLEHLPLPPGSGTRTRAADARRALEAAPAGSYDLIVADVFGGSRIPAHLTTRECAEAAARALRPHGLHVANIADGAPFAFLRAQAATLAAVFGHVCLMAEPAVLRGRRFGNVVLVASAAALPLEALSRACAGDPFPARVEHGAALRRLVGDARPVQDADALPSPPPPPGSFSIG
ncbi:fused MFS/spermidine synthase [Streptomyces chumphonensis]|uniref:Fused MFS/spermidine synthase n=1 Tax=Streptomyces chumphonensis TaxID=1214925 RepID=A0A927F295_9ACTN|nr:fused MFS/spermidine synthase [Streptomyces chumphonensis]MBD3933878.1 fused MFS/spermidine synthase [Streptomyces chumphonensis]